MSQLLNPVRDPSDRELELQQHFRIKLKLPEPLSDDQILQLSSLNNPLRLEQTSYGELIIMSPANAQSGRYNAYLTWALVNWNMQQGLGEVFDSSAGFKLPNGATYAPDVAWVKRERWDALTSDQQESYAPLCPDFVVELRSKSDTIKELKEKMQEYIDNGAQLGWLIDPKSRRVWIYRPDHLPEELPEPETLSGDPILAGFILKLEQIWI